MEHYLYLKPFTVSNGYIYSNKSIDYEIDLEGFAGFRTGEHTY